MMYVIYCTTMQYFQNAPAYFARALSYGHKMFMKLTHVVNVIRLFIILALTKRPSGQNIGLCHAFSAKSNICEQVRSQLKWSTSKAGTRILD